MQLAAVYFFEYVASTGAADRAEKIGKKANNEWVARNAYAILAFCYQVLSLCVCVCVCVCASCFGHVNIPCVIVHLAW